MKGVRNYASSRLRITEKITLVESDLGEELLVGSVEWVGNGLTTAV